MSFTILFSNKKKKQSTYMYTNKNLKKKSSEIMEMHCVRNN